MSDLKGPDGVLMQRTRELFLGQIEAHGLGRIFNPEEIMVSLPDSLRCYTNVAGVEGNGGTDPSVCSCFGSAGGHEYAR